MEERFPPGHRLPAMDSPYRFGHLNAPAPPRYDYRPHPHRHPLFLDADDHHRHHRRPSSPPPPPPPPSHQYLYQRRAPDEPRVLYDPRSPPPRDHCVESYPPRRLNPRPLEFDRRHEPRRFHDDVHFHSRRLVHHSVPMDEVFPPAKTSAVPQHLHPVPLPRRPPHEEILAPQHWLDKRSLPRFLPREHNEAPHNEAPTENLQWKYNNRQLITTRPAVQDRPAVSVWDRIEVGPPSFPPPVMDYLPSWDQLEDTPPTCSSAIKHLPVAENAPEMGRLDIFTKPSEMREKVVVQITPSILKPADEAVLQPFTKWNVSKKREKVVVQITPAVSKSADNVVPPPCSNVQTATGDYQYCPAESASEHVSTKKLTDNKVPRVNLVARAKSRKTPTKRSSKDICSSEVASAKVLKTSSDGNSNENELHNKDVTIATSKIPNIDSKGFDTHGEVSMLGKPKVVAMGYEGVEDIEEGEFVEPHESASVDPLNASASNAKTLNNTDSCTPKIDAQKQSSDAAILDSIDTNCMQVDSNPLFSDICIQRDSNPCMYGAQLSDSLVDRTKNTRPRTSVVEWRTENMASDIGIVNNTGFQFSMLDGSGRALLDNYAPIGLDKSLSSAENQLAIDIDSETKVATKNIGLSEDSTKIVQQPIVPSSVKSMQGVLSKIRKEKRIKTMEKQLKIPVGANGEKVTPDERSKDIDAHMQTQVNMSIHLPPEVKDFDGACSVHSLHDDMGFCGCKDIVGDGEGTNGHTQCPVFKTGQDILLDKVFISHESKFKKLPMIDESEKQKCQNSVTTDRVSTCRKVTVKPRDLNPLPITSSIGVSKEVTHGNFSLWRRTWQRSNSSWQRSNSNSYISEVHCNRQTKGASILNKRSPKKSKLSVSSYVRKGSCLIRNPNVEQTNIARKSTNGVDFVQPPSVSLASVRSDRVVKPSFKAIESKKNGGNDRKKISNISFEHSMLEILPNPSVNVTQDDSGEVLGTPEIKANDENQTRECKNQSAELIPADANKQSLSGSEKQEPFDMNKTMYAEPKPNQLVASVRPPSDNSSINSMEKDTTLTLLASSGIYYRKKNNQLIRNTLPSCPSKEEAAVATGPSNSDDRRVSGLSPSECRSRNRSKRRIDEVVWKSRKHSRFSQVWTLSDEGIRGKNVKLLDHQQVLQSLFPWKRASGWIRSAPISNKRSLSLIRKKLQLATKRKTIYRVSTDGFSLHKARVLGIGGCSLKWSKSIDKHSKKANEEATLAVAEVERKIRERKQAAPIANKKNGNRLCRERVFRVGTARYKMDATRRTLIRIHDDQSTCLDQQSECEHRDSVIPSRLLIDNDEYIRVGSGNKLVRDPKKLKRMLANEKIRWSLHNARLRLAKKQQYCQFFTRFGKCNKNGGKCPYMHDPTKIVICTKFLKGSCSDVDCKLTHKILPERMPDCSYFLQGLCTNISCPYRHVKVNSKASVCEGFLRGFCAEGDECRKKHSYVCPNFEATGKCLQGSACKLHHPKSSSKGKKLYSKAKKNTSGRYFGPCTREISNPIASASKHVAVDEGGNVFCSGEQFTDYISLDVISDDKLAQMDENQLQRDQNLDEQPDYISLDSVTDDEVVQMDMDGSDLDQNLSELEPDELDKLIKPFRIMNKGILTSFSACI